VTRASSGREWAALATLGVAVALTMHAMAAPAGPAGETPRRGHEIAVEARDGSGDASAQLDVAGVTATLAGEALAVTAARPIARGDWNVVIYVDGLAAGRDEIERSAAALEAAGAAIAALGPVTLLVADTLVEPWLEDATDADELRSSFAELAAATFEPPEQRPPDFAASRRALLLDQLGRRRWGSGPRALLVVGDVNGERAGGGGASPTDPAARRGELAAAVASLGWVALPFHFTGQGGGIAVSPLAEETGGEAILDAGALGPALERLGARRLVRLEVPAGGDATGAGAIAPLTISGPPGWSVRGPRWIATATPAFVLLARVNGLFADEESGELQVVASAELDSDAAGDQELAVEVLAETVEGGRSSAGGVAGSSARLRVSFVLARLEDSPIVVHYAGSGIPLGAGKSWLLQARLDAPDELEAVAVVVEDVTTGAWGATLAEVDGEEIESPGIDRLAVEVADLRAAKRATTVAAAGAPATGGEPPLVRLVPPRERELTGVQTFRAMALSAFIERVAFFLDGRQVAEDKDNPFAARLDLGPEPRSREIRAVAYDRAGRQLGEDTVTVNRPRAAFGVDIVEVKGAGTGGDGSLSSAPRPAAAGPIEVRAEVSVPPRRRVARVEIYWNETLAATLTTPPWTAKLDARPSGPADYVRAVAHLDDGESLEDVMLVGAAGQVEEVEVNLVEIFAVVLDREGSPVSDLQRGEVTVRLGGKEIELERFGMAEDLQLDVGLVIDTSGSMEFLIDDTRQAALRFLADLVRPGDRAFLVDFDTKPRLAQPMTKQVTDLVRALGSLRAEGNTALYDSIVFSILHFEEGEDRRAVVLLTDGEDYRSRFSAHQAALQARSAGVPIYMISLAGMDSLRPALRKTDLETIAKQTGGHVFYVSAREELSPAYARISAELRSQYVLTFTTPRALSEGELAKLEVRVSRAGATVRAVVAGRSVQTR
jgi:Ca-activated chloride channel homolog